MNKQKGFSGVILIIGVFVLLAGALGYWFLMQPSPAPATSATTELPSTPQNQQTNQQPAAPSKPKPSATADKLAPAGGTPEFIVSGTASNTNSVNVIVRAITPAKSTGYTGLYTQDNVPVVNGRWSVTISAYAFSGFSEPYNVLVEATVLGTNEVMTSKDLSLTLPPTITAKVVSGNAPLTVQFSVSYLGLGAHWVEFGDGQQASVDCSTFKPDTDACAIFNDEMSHTYTQPGTYTAKYIEEERGASGTNTRVTGSVTIAVK